MYKRLYENDQWTKEGSDLERELTEVLKPVFNKYINEGYSIRDIISVTHQSTDIYLMREICKRMSKERLGK